MNMLYDIVRDSQHENEFINSNIAAFVAHS